MLKRTLKTAIDQWISEGKEALMVIGARQTGKTFLIRECLKASAYSYIEFNFIEQPELISLFANAYNAKDLLMRISLAIRQPLIPHKTILFFDEVQEFKDILTRIKFLVEEGSYKYILSSSLLGVELHNLRSAPVGSLRILDMYPMTFQGGITSFICFVVIHIWLVKSLLNMKGDRIIRIDFKDKIR